MSTNDTTTPPPGANGEPCPECGHSHPGGACHEMITEGGKTFGCTCLRGAGAERRQGDRRPARTVAEAYEDAAALAGQWATMRWEAAEEEGDEAYEAAAMALEKLSEALATLATAARERGEEDAKWDVWVAENERLRDLLRESTAEVARLRRVDRLCSVAGCANLARYGNEMCELPSCTRRPFFGPGDARPPPATVARHPDACHACDGTGDGSPVGPPLCGICRGTGLSEEALDRRNADPPATVALGERISPSQLREALGYFSKKQLQDRLTAARRAVLAEVAEQIRAYREHQANLYATSAAARQRSHASHEIEERLERHFAADWPPGDAP